MKMRIDASATLTGTRSCRLMLSLAMISANTACSSFLDDLLDVENPGTVLEDTLRDPTNASLLVAGLMNDFACAFAGYIVAGGAIGTEVAWGDTNTFDYDRRTWTSSGGVYATGTCSVMSSTLAVYTPLSTARWSADNAHQILSGFTDAQVPNRGALLAAASAYSGYSHLLLGEAMCGASIDGGPMLSRDQLSVLAEQKLTAAITEGSAANDASLVNMALVGRARARINLSRATAGKAAEAAADAAQVPDGFSKMALYAATDVRSSNQVYWWINEQGRAAVDSPFWNLTFQGVPDPRVAVTQSGKQTQDGFTPWVLQTKYTSRGASIPIAKWAEAQLIIAEVKGGAAAIAIINTLHQRAGLPAFSSSDPVEIRQQVIEERRRELFVESHHLGDMIRFGIPFLPSAGTPYKPTGGGVYGAMTCLPYPDVERS